MRSELCSCECVRVLTSFCICVFEQLFTGVSPPQAEVGRAAERMPAGWSIYLRDVLHYDELD